MADVRPTRIWIMRASFWALALAVMFYHLLPLDLTPTAIAGPDLLTALCFAWALRRPDYVPALSIACVMLLADLMFQRPPGLWAGLVLIGSELLKSRERRGSETTFLQEWLTVALVLLVLTVVYRFTLTVLLVPTGTMALGLSRYALTVAIYPLVVALSQMVLGIRRTVPGDFDHAGRPL